MVNWNVGPASAAIWEGLSNRGDCPSFEPATERIAALASALLETRGPHVEMITALTRTA